MFEGVGGLDTFPTPGVVLPPFVGVRVLCLSTNTGSKPVLTSPRSQKRSCRPQPAPVPVHEPEQQVDEEVDTLEPELPPLPPEHEPELSREVEDVELEFEEQDRKVDDGS